MSGDEWQKLRNYYDAAGDGLSREEEIELIRKAQAGDTEARNEVVTNFLRFVMRIAKAYQFKGLDYEDLVMEGNFGLFRAIEKFDPDRGYRFSTYAAPWIRQFIARAVMDLSRTVRVPIHMQKKIPTNNPRNSDLLGKSLSVDQYAEFDKYFDEVDHDGLGEIAEAETKEILLALLAEEKPKKQKAIVARFGLDGRDGRTFDEAGDESGVTRERVRQMIKEFGEKVRPQLESMGIR